MFEHAANLVYIIKLSSPLPLVVDARQDGKPAVILRNYWMLNAAQLTGEHKSIVQLRHEVDPDGRN